MSLEPESPYAYDEEMSQAVAGGGSPSSPAAAAPAASSSSSGGGFPSRAVTAADVSYAALAAAIEELGVSGEFGELDASTLKVRVRVHTWAVEVSWRADGLLERVSPLERFSPQSQRVSAEHGVAFSWFAHLVLSALVMHLQGGEPLMLEHLTGQMKRRHVERVKLLGIDREHVDSDAAAAGHAARLTACLAPVFLPRLVARKVVRSLAYCASALHLHCYVCGRLHDAPTYPKLCGSTFCAWQSHDSLEELDLFTELRLKGDALEGVVKRRAAEAERAARGEGDAWTPEQVPAAYYVRDDSTVDVPALAADLKRLQGLDYAQLRGCTSNVALWLHIAALTLREGHVPREEADAIIAALDASPRPFVAPLGQVFARQQSVGVPAQVSSTPIDLRRSFALLYAIALGVPVGLRFSCNRCGAKFVTAHEQAEHAVCDASGGGGAGGAGGASSANPNVHPPPAPAQWPPLVLAPCQTSALARVRASASAASAAALAEGGVLRTRALTLGISDADVRATLEYMRTRAPLIIHVTVPSVLQLLYRDTHFRNLFETGHGKGSNDISARTSWEQRMFHDSYDDALPHERVKYGCVNTTGSGDGVDVAQHYGDSFLILSESVRSRVTVTNEDSSTTPSASMVGTPEHFAHVLARFTDPELRAVVAAACGTRQQQLLGGSSASTAKYKELQVHGELLLSRRDFAAFVLEDLTTSGAAGTPQGGALSQDVLALAQAFAQKVGIPLVLAKQWRPGGSYRV